MRTQPDETDNEDEDRPKRRREIVDILAKAIVNGQSLRAVRDSVEEVLADSAKDRLISLQNDRFL